MFDELDIQSALLILLIIMICIALYFLYQASVREKLIKQKLDDFKLNCPACPKCPDYPECDCPENKTCPPCPACPSLKCPEKTCPDVRVPSVNDIVNGIFPGRNQGMTLGGNLFPVSAFDESCPRAGDTYQDVPVGSNVSDIVDLSSGSSTKKDPVDDKEEDDTEEDDTEEDDKKETKKP
jgi:hypothetical protein